MKKIKPSKETQDSSQEFENIEVLDLNSIPEDDINLNNDYDSDNDIDSDLNWESLEGNINISDTNPYAEDIAEYYEDSEKKSHLALFIVLGCIFVILVLAGINYYMGYKNAIGVFQHNTYINNTDVSCKTAAQVSEELLYENTDFTIKAKDGVTLTLKLQDMGYVETPETAYEELIARQDPYLWFKYYFEETRYVDFAGVTIEKEDIIAALNKTELVTKAVKSTNAEIKKNSKGFYELIPETVGNEIDIDKAADLIKEALTSKVYEVDLVASECYIYPEITQDNELLVNANAQLTALYDEVITIDVTGKTETIDKKIIKNYITLNEDYTISFNETKIKDYAQYLKDTYETLGYSRKFKSTNQGTVKVGTSNDTWGFAMDFDATLETLRAAITSGITQTITPVWTSEAPTRSDEYGDIGSTYIEISITDQHLWYYIDGNLSLDTDIITGLSTVEERHTPEGVFILNDIASDINLTGSMGDETWDEHVDYWLGFLENIGMHDASWQTAGFGGNLYTYRGSHGCVNLPTDKMKQLYESISYGIPVVVY